MKKLFLLLALMGMVAVGCSKDVVDKGNDNKTEQPNENEGGNIPDDAYISLNKEIVTISPDGESVGVKVYSNYAWELTNNCDWITTSITSGDASDTGVTVTLTADLTYDDREGTVVFSCGKAKKLLVVSQKLKEVIIPDAKNTFNIPAEGGVAVISYQTNIDCEVIIPKDAQSWITIAPATRGLSTYSTTLNIAENNPGKARSCVVKVASQGDNALFAEYTIIQNSRYCLYYTSSNGEIVQPYDSSAFGETIISNTYIDGVGAIEFDAPITTIGESAFCECSSLTSIAIPDSVTSIGDYAFYNCSSLTSITIPDSVTTIGFGAFAVCSSLTSVTIPDSVTTIGDGAFSGCSSLQEFNGKLASDDGRCLIIDGTLNSFAPAGLTEYTIPDSVTTIGWWAFQDCSSLTSVTIPDSVTSIGDSAFSGCSSLTSVTIHDSVTEIGGYAFYDCSSLASVTIPDSVTTIGDKTFALCSSLTSVTIPDSVTTIGDSAFSGCSSLTSVTIPNSVTTIGYDAFNGCSSLTSIAIPDSATAIGDYAFAECSSLTNVYCKATTPPVALIYWDYWYAFRNNASGRKIYVPMESVEAYKSAQGWSEYASDIVGYDFENGVVVTPKPANNEIWYTNGSTTEAITPNRTNAFGANIVSNTYDDAKECWVITFDGKVTAIGGYAFDGRYSLTSVTIPDSVTRIGEGAFYECKSLTSVTIPDSVTTIDGYAFYYCNKLTSVTIPDSVTSIRTEAFSYCSSLTSVYCKATTPPAGESSMFSANASDRKIYVPMESVEAYKSASYWSDYSYYIEGYNF